MKLLHLDAARGIASIIVVFHHYSLGFAPAAKAAFTNGLWGNLAGWILNGTGAVAFFFALSGFVLTRRYFDTSDHRLLLRGALKRFPRLYVSCALSVLIGFVVLKWGSGSYLSAAEITGSEWLRSYGNADLPARDLTFFDAIFQSFAVLLLPGSYYFNSNLWTMFSEFWGSQLCFAFAAILFFAARFSTTLATLFSALMLGMIHVYSDVIPMGYQINLLGSSLLVGCTMAYLTARGLILPTWMAYPAIILGLIACAQVQPGFDKLGGAAILAGLVSMRTPPALLTGRLGHWLGELSFPLYLVHTVVLLSVGASIFTTLTLSGFGGAMIHLLTLSSTLITSFLLCIPFIRIERWWVPVLGAWARKIV